MIFPEYLNVCTLKLFGDLVDDGVRCDSRDGRSKNLTASAKGGFGNAEMIAECQWPVSGSRSESAEIQNLICTDRRYGIDYSMHAL